VNESTPRAQHQSGSMAKLTLKVSIDDSRYVIRGIDKESSRKEILCILAKYKKKDQLPELRSALSKLNSSISKIEVKASNKVENATKRDQTTSKIGSRKKGRCKTITNRACLSNDCSVDASFCNGEIKASSFMKQRENLRKGRPTIEKVSCNTKYRKKPGRSHSFNENDKRQKKYRLRERPKSFGAFDAAKILKLGHSTLLELNQIFDIHGLQKLNKESLEESGKENNDSSKIARSRKHRAITSNNVNIRSKQKKLKHWLENLATNSVQYFIEENETQKSCSSDQQNCLASTKKGEERTENAYYPYQFKNDKKKNYIENTDTEYAEAETDSGLPSLDYESSLDTLSRDDRISIEQSCDEGRSKDVQEDSVFDCSCWNESKTGTNTSFDRGNIEECINKENEELQNVIVGTNISATESQLSEESNPERTKINKHQGTESGPTNSELAEKADDDLFTAVKCTIEKISKADENILHCELLISQLEFQFDILSENIDTVEDIEIELEEMKLVTELKDTEEFLKAITKLSQYQREAESEIVAEILNIDAKLKERQMKLQSFERKLIRQKFKSVPRHLIVSREKRRYAHHMTSDVGFSSDNEILLLDSESNSISLV